MISSITINGIDLDMDLKPEFCKSCAKAKSARQPFLKKSDTRTTKYGEQVHWDLWDPSRVSMAIFVLQHILMTTPTRANSTSSQTSGNFLVLQKG
jgi:hypothetical protein